MDKAERKKYAQLDKEIAKVSNTMAIIVARHKKVIWTDKAYDKDRKDVLRNAELTLRLAEDTEYITLQEQLWDFEAQMKELGDFFDI